MNISTHNDQRLYYHQKIYKTVLQKEKNRQKGERLIALFDLDDTIIEGDVGHAMLWWSLKNNLIKQPIEIDWHYTSPFLTDYAAHQLSAISWNCAAPGESINIHDCPELADEILSIYFLQKTTDGEKAFQGYKPAYMNPSYAWAGQLLAGNDENKIISHASALVEIMMNSSRKSFISVGKKWKIPAYIRIRESIIDIIQFLKKHQYEVWVVSASLKPVISVFAPHISLQSSHFIGLELQKDSNNQLSAEFKNHIFIDANYIPVMTTREGKCHFIRQKIFNNSNQTASLAFGNSINDFEMLLLADDLKVIMGDKDKKLTNYCKKNDNSWLIEPLTRTNPDISQGDLNYNNSD